MHERSLSHARVPEDEDSHPLVGVHRREGAEGGEGDRPTERDAVQHTFSTNDTVQSITKEAKSVLVGEMRIERKYVWPQTHDLLSVSTLSLCKIFSST